MSLDATPSDADLLAMKARREKKDALPPQLVAQVVAPRPKRPRSAIDGHWTLEKQPADRSGQGYKIHGTITGAPRTKKNSKVHYTRQSPQYAHYEKGIVRLFGNVLVLKGKLTRLGPPLLVDGDYNLKAVFYVDPPGRQADLVGLLQGLADALERAGVVENDRQFRAFDGSRTHHSDPRNPRVEFEIEPLAR